MSTSDPVVTAIRSKLAQPSLHKGAHADDLTALADFYGQRTGPLWMTEMGFSARAQSALFEIEKAADWGLERAAFDLPESGALPANAEAQALAETGLGLAILQYARFARGGRLVPSEISALFDQEPALRDPRIVLAEIAASAAPGPYLQSLHPSHEGFKRLREALVAARAKDENRAQDPKDAKEQKDAKARIVLNMERWRWLPEDLGAVHVLLNTPEFMLYMIKDGKVVYTDKTLVGTIGNATPVFSADMATLVFNPEWIAPRTVLKETLLPPLRRKNYDFLKKHKFTVSRGGKPVNVSKIKWSAANIHSYTFIQKPGPGNNLGKIKFLYPNKHDVYMHDTLPVRRKVFQKQARAIGYGCVRMEKPNRFAEMLLAEDKAWPASKVKGMWDKSVNGAVTLDRPIPVHTTYFTVVADEKGKVATFADIYGLDHKLAAALFGSAQGFPMPPPEKKRGHGEEASASARRSSGGLAAALQGLLGD